MATGAAGMKVDFPVHPDVEQRNAVGIAIRAYGSELSAEPTFQHFICALLGHRPIGAT
jgi:hypothetical protein